MIKGSGPASHIYNSITMVIEYVEKLETPASGNIVHLSEVLIKMISGLDSSRKLIAEKFPVLNKISSEDLTDILSELKSIENRIHVHEPYNLDHDLIHNNDFKDIQFMIDNFNQKITTHLR